MASAVILTYERKSSFNRSASMKKSHHGSNAFSMDSAVPDRSYAHEAVGDSSDLKRPRRPSDFPCTAQNFSTRSKELHHETGSDDSTSLKRKSICLSGKLTKDGRLSSGALLKDLSRDEKRELRMRIKKELRQVRSITQKLEAREFEVRNYSQPFGRSDTKGVDSNGHYVPATAESSFQETDRFAKRRFAEVRDVNDDGMNFDGKEKKTPKTSRHGVNPEPLSGKDKLPPSEKGKVKGATNVKRGLNGRFEPRDPKKQKFTPAANKKISELMKHCNSILNKMMLHKFGWVFNEPVDAVKLNLHDYHKIIKKPMDLGTIKQKLATRAYLLPTEFCEDVRLTFSNAMTYNPQGHDVYHMAEFLKGMFESKWKTLEDKLKALDSALEQSVAEEVQESRPHLAPNDQVMPLSSALPSSVSMPPSKKAKLPGPARSSSKVKGKSMPTQKSREMTYDEKQRLSDLLGTLSADKLERAVQIMRKNPSLTQTDDEIEVDIESFDTDTLWELHHLVMESSNASYEEPVQAPTFSASEVSVQVPKVLDGVEQSNVNEPGEEEVDIGDDMPTKEFPPVVIEKDKVTSHAGNSSSSSSSSGSGSSSSDSESGSSSGSDSEADDARSPEAVSKVSTVDKEL